jgi:hypothetical protein
MACNSKIDGVLTDGGTVELLAEQHFVLWHEDGSGVPDSRSRKLKGRQ